jgi:hypothetical protein
LIIAVLSPLLATAATTAAVRIHLKKSSNFSVESLKIVDKGKVS